MKRIWTLEKLKSLHCYQTNQTVQIHVVYLQCWVTSGWWMCLTEYHTLGVFQHFPSYQNAALKKNSYSDVMRSDLFLPYGIRIFKTFTNIWPKIVYYSISQVTNTTQAILTGYAVQVHVTSTLLLTLLPPVHQEKHCIFAGFDCKSSASGMQQLGFCFFQGLKKTI